MGYNKLKSEIRNKQNNTRFYILSLFSYFLILIIIFPISYFISPKTVHAGVLSRPPTNLGLVGYWPMDEGVGNKIFDTSGQNNTGVITSATWTNGKHGKALNFNGSTSVVWVADTGTVLDFSSTTPYAWSQWLSITSTSTVQCFISKDVPPTASKVDGFNICLNPTGNTADVVVCKYNSALDAAPTCSTGLNLNLPQNQWVNVVVTYDGASNWGVYLNGAYKGSMVLSVFSDNYSSYLIGAGQRALTGNGLQVAGLLFNGKIDDVRIYNRALTATEISKLYSSGGVRAKSGPKLVQTTSCDISSNACTVNLSLTPGNFIFIAQSGSSTNGPYSASDTLGNVYLTANPYNTDPQFTGNNDNQTLYSANIKGGSATITCTRTSNGGGSRCLIMEFSGIALSNPLDAHAENRNTSTALNSGSIVTRYPGELLIGFFADTGGTYTAGSQYQLPFGSARSLEYKISSAPGSYSATATHSNSNTAWGSIAAFKTAFQPTKINSSQNNKLTNGLVGMWSFNGADMNWASGIAYDSSGQGNNGTLTNMSATTSPAAGKVGQALKFDKVDDFVDVGSPAMYDNLPTLSYCAWVKPNTFGEIFIGMIFAKGFSKYFGITGSNKLNFTVQYDGADLNKTTTSDMVYGVWSHVCATWAGGPDASSVKLYVNGISVATTDSSATGTVLLEQTEPYAIGNVDGATRTFDGAIDEVRLYNRALSTDEVKQLYNMGK